MIRNHTIQRQLTNQELLDREAFLEQNHLEVDRVNAEFMLAGQQQRAFERQAQLVAVTRLELSQLLAIRSWLQASP